jgi:hypothetical protein
LYGIVDIFVKKPLFEFLKINISTFFSIEISESRAWDIVGELLSDGLLESTHDQITGEMKLCETGKIYSIMDLEIKRKREKFKSFSKKKKS